MESHLIDRVYIILIIEWNVKKKIYSELTQFLRTFMKN